MHNVKISYLIITELRHALSSWLLLSSISFIKHSTRTTPLALIPSYYSPVLVLFRSACAHITDWAYQIVSEQFRNEPHMVLGLRTNRYGLTDVYTGGQKFGILTLISFSLKKK